MSFLEWFNRHIAPRMTALGITPRSVTLEVRGRRSGKPIRLSLSPARLDGKEYLVSLFGEQNWVKNVRASGGKAHIVHGSRKRIQLAEVPIDQRAPILLAYVSERAFSRSSKEAARMYFDLENPTLEDMKRIADRYPVFLIELRQAQPSVVSCEAAEGRPE
ncbi:MAG: nitroreductase/quinone reductase family protein [Deltaproteobacteria bacterium]|nr:nitroreductase/quinone reductase family protein [Deltaproteobacteria bacterium]